MAHTVLSGSAALFSAGTPRELSGSQLKPSHPSPLPVHSTLPFLPSRAFSPAILLSSTIYNWIVPITYKYAALPPIIIKTPPPKKKTPKTKKQKLLTTHLDLVITLSLYSRTPQKMLSILTVSNSSSSSPMNPLPSPSIHQNGSCQAEYTGASWSQRLNSTILQASSQTIGSLMEVFTACKLVHTTDQKSWFIQSSSEWKSWLSPSFIINYQSSNYLIYW